MLFHERQREKDKKYYGIMKSQIHSCSHKVNFMQILRLLLLYLLSASSHLTVLQQLHSVLSCYGGFCCVYS